MCFYLLKRKSSFEPATIAPLSFACGAGAGAVDRVKLEHRRFYALVCFTTRGDPTPGRMEAGRRESAREADPAGATRIAPAGAPIYEPGTRRPHAANHGATRRSLPATGRSYQTQLAEPGPLCRCGRATDAAYHG